MTDERKVAGNILARMGGRTAEDVAKAARIHKNTMHNYIRGRCEPGAFKLKRIADALGCTTDELLEGVGE